ASSRPASTWRSSFRKRPAPPTPRRPRSSSSSSTDGSVLFVLTDLLRPREDAERDRGQDRGRLPPRPLARQKPVGRDRGGADRLGRRRGSRGRRHAEGAAALAGGRFGGGPP